MRGLGVVRKKPKLLFSSRGVNCSLSEWTDKVDCMPHSWPKSFNIGRMQMGPVQANTFHLHRKFTRARHMWLSLQPNWRLLSSRMYTDWPGIHSYEEINDRLFVNPGRNDNIQDTPSKAQCFSPTHLHWVGQQQYTWQFVDAQVPPVRITMGDTLAEYRANPRVEQAEIAAHSSAARGRKRWKTKEGVYQLKDPEKLEQAVPNTDDAMLLATMVQSPWTFLKRLVWHLRCCEKDWFLGNRRDSRSQCWRSLL